ncbi:IS3 family transposase [Kitasatospora sp. NPDC008050]|uniref:IS3 family transposase n=1 Tax=Kitasatospora sp. NPDC008050 TaxID=3364021 RepID=UPI0036E3EA09
MIRFRFVFRFVQDYHGAWGVKRICLALGIARSSFYAWRAGEQARRARERAEDLLAAEITVIHLAPKGAYGVPRVHAELRRQAGRSIGRRWSGSRASAASRASPGAGAAG